MVDLAKLTYECICGGELRSTRFKAMRAQTFEVVEITALSCPTEGGQGNIAERWSKLLEKIKEEIG